MTQILHTGRANRGRFLHREGKAGRFAYEERKPNLGFRF
jgi:hypothetical protein